MTSDEKLDMALEAEEEKGREEQKKNPPPWISAIILAILFVALVLIST